MAIVLTFDGAVGSRRRRSSTATTPAAPGGPFTYREGKAQAIRELAEREGIDLAASWAYSDSESDLPMLRAVGHPVAVNPDKTLARVAREEGWEILRFDRRRAAVRGRRGGGRGGRRRRGRHAGARMSLHELTPSSRRSASWRAASPTRRSRRAPPSGTATTSSRASCSPSSASSG